MRCLFVLLLAGCASSPWNHPSKGEQEFHQDALECERLAAATYPPDMAFAMVGMQRRCMRAKGWVRQ